MLKYSYVVETPYGSKIVEADSLDAAILQQAKYYGFSSRPATQKDKQEALARQLQDVEEVKDNHSYEYTPYRWNYNISIPANAAAHKNYAADPSSTEDDLQKVIEALDAVLSLSEDGPSARQQRLVDFFLLGR